MILHEQIKRLRELEAKATPGPWAQGIERKDFIYGGKGNCEYIGMFGENQIPSQEQQHNASLVAETRNALPGILDALEDLLHAKEVLEKAILK